MKSLWFKCEKTWNAVHAFSNFFLGVILNQKHTHYKL